MTAFARVGGYDYRGCVRDGTKVTGERTDVRYGSGAWYAFEADWDLLKISAALADHPEIYPRVWAHTDAYGPVGYRPEGGYDWSGIRDSSKEVVKAMAKIADEYVSDADLMAALGIPLPEPPPRPSNETYLLDPALMTAAEREGWIRNFKEAPPTLDYMNEWIWAGKVYSYGKEA